jgi:hypothetical protein
MKFISNKTSPQPVLPNLWVSPPTSPTNAQLDPMLHDPIGNVKEKKDIKSNSMRMADWDMFGEPIKLNWNKSDSYKTKTGVGFTALFVAALGYVIWVYFGEFIQCKQPNVYESTGNDSLEGDDPDNNLANLFPVISFLDYSQPRPWPMALPAVPFSDITCHFAVEFGHATSSAYEATVPTPIPINGDCNEKFKEMYKKKTGKDDETLSKNQYLICPDTNKLPLLGDGTDCHGSGPCSHYRFIIHKHFKSTAHCNPVNVDMIIVNISYISPKLRVNNFDNPWSYEIDTESTTLSQTQTNMMVINHFYTTLETVARRFGLNSLSNTEKKLTRNPVVRVDKSPYLSHGYFPYLVLV